MGAPLGSTVFDSASGVCGVAWSVAGIVGVALPERDAQRVAARLARRHPGAVPAAPPPTVVEAIGAMTALLAGEPRDLRAVALDLDGVPDFHRRVYDIVRAIAPGTTRTYGEVAAAVGEPDGAQAVGQAMGRNPVPIIVPCHRVVAAGGALGGFSADGGAATKQKMLVIEGALPAPPPTLFDALGV